MSDAIPRCKTCTHPIHRDDYEAARWIWLTEKGHWFGLIFHDKCRQPDGSLLIPKEIVDEYLKNFGGPELGLRFEDLPAEQLQLYLCHAHGLQEHLNRKALEMKA